MAIISTGSSIYNYIRNKLGMNFSIFTSPIQMNVFLEEAFIQVLKGVYTDTIQDNKFKDEISPFISTNNVLSVINNNSFYTTPLTILTLTYTVSVGVTTWILTTLLPNNIAIGDTINISNVLGTLSPNPSGNYVVTGITSTTITFTTPSVTTGVYTNNSGSIYLVNGSMINYKNFLNIKAQFINPIDVVSISFVSNTSPIRITLNNYNKFRTSNLKYNVQIGISGVIGNTNANGTFYIKKVNDLMFDLYDDIKLQVPISGNGVFSGSPIMNTVTYNTCRPYLPDEEISVLNTPTVEKPRYQIANSQIKIYPLTSNCTQITLDCIINPYNIYGTGLFIDCTDSVVNVLNYYPEDFIDNVMNKCMLILAEMSRESEATNNMIEQISNNK